VAKTTETPVERTARVLRTEAMHCEVLGSPLYAGLLRHAAEDLLAGGPTAEVLAGHLTDPGRGVLALRMLGGVHALVLTGQAAGLAKFYPSAGGTADPGNGASQAWPALRDVLEHQRDQVRAWLPSPPQTNEVGRGAALVGVLCHLTGHTRYPVRLFEIGASAGLNLRADRFHITGGGVSYGGEFSPVRMPGGWRGCPPAARSVELIERIGGDLAPVDPLSADGQLRLSAYVWADQTERLARLRGAFELAAAIPAELRTEPAAVTVAGISPEPGTWTVLWHSIFRQYLTAEQVVELEEAIASVGARATTTARFAHVSMEPVRGTFETPVEVTAWPGGVRRTLGTAPPHGLPVTWAC
jgi:hypothetical protein